MPAIDDVSLIPQPVKILPKVSFALSKFNLADRQGALNNWTDFGTWYYKNLVEPVAVSTPAIKAEIASLQLQGSVEEKVKKIYQYMQNKTRYIYVGL